LGIPIPTIDISVSMRAISALKLERQAAEKLYNKPSNATDMPTVADIENALYFAFIVTYAQGMTQLVAASAEYNYGLNLEVISKIWRGGCIIRAGLLEEMRKAFSADNKLKSILLDDYFAGELNNASEGMRKVVSFAINSGIPVSALSTCMSYFDAYTTGRLPLNLIQAQRDHFGSHTYERVDREGIFHTEW
jgi:6-phosphogluconate dehydrogenase